MSLGPEDIREIRSRILPKLIRVSLVQAYVLVALAALVLVVAWWAASKAPQVVAVSETGRVVPLTANVEYQNSAPSGKP